MNATAPFPDRDALRHAGREQIKAVVRPLFEATYGRWENAQGTAHAPEAWYELLVCALQAEAETLEDLVALGSFAFVARVTECTAEARQALAGEKVPVVLARCRETLAPDQLVTPEIAQEYFRGLRHHFRDRAGLRGREVMLPLRAALTGTLRGPCLGKVASLLGYVRCAQRLEDALQCLRLNV